MNKYKIIINRYGDMGWLVNGFIHREDGPAVEYLDGRKEWIRNGKYHREDGPAVLDDCGLHKEWHLDGEKLTEVEHAKRMSDG